MDRRKATLGVAGIGIIAGAVGLGLLAAPAGAGQAPSLPPTTPQALVNTTQRINIKVELGSVADTITVTETIGATVNTTDASIAGA